MTIAAFALIVLALVIAIGYFSKVNMGIIAIAASLMLGYVGGLTDTEILKGFPLALFINLSGMFFLFSIAECNDVIQLLAKKVLYKLPKSRKLYPIFVFIVIVLLSFASTGSMAVYSFTPLVTMTMAAYLGVNPIMVGIMTIFAACVGNFCPIGFVSVAITGISAGSGFTGVAWPLLGCAAIAYSILAALTYIIFRGFRPDMNIETASNSVEMDFSTPAFNRNQKVISLMILVWIVGTTILKSNPGLPAYFCAGVLLLLKTADEKAAFQKTPWGLIIMITGYGTLMGVATSLGGVELLSDFFASIANKYIAGPILGFTSSVMSLFSFALAGPIPALIPTVSAVSEAIGGSVKTIEMIAAICIGGFSASISPLSLGGALILSSYNQIIKPDEKTTNKVFNKLLAWAIVGSLIIAVISATNIYGIFG